MRGGVIAWMAAGVLLGSCAEASEQSSVSDESPPLVVSEPVTSPTVSEAPSSTTSAPTPVPSSEVPPVTEPPTSSAPDGVTRLLVADHEGLWLATTDGRRRQLVGGAIRWAIPDRVGGVLFQRVETGTWRPIPDPAAPDTAHWRWVGSGAAQPIWRMQPGEAPRMLVEAPVDGRLELIDTAIVDGDPTVAYLRTRYFTITTTEDRGPWWDSAVAELLVRNLDSGAERVLRTQDVDGSTPPGLRHWVPSSPSTWSPTTPVKASTSSTGPSTQPSNRAPNCRHVLSRRSGRIAIWSPISHQSSQRWRWPEADLAAPENSTWLSWTSAAVANSGASRLRPTRGVGPGSSTRSATTR